MRGYFTRVVRPCAVAAATVGLGGCVEVVESNIVTIAAERPERGTTAEIAVPLPDAPAVTIAALESEAFTVHASQTEPDKVRLLVSHGTTLTSWGEVGRVELTPVDADRTRLYAIVERLVAVKGDPSVEGPFLAEWLAAIPERYRTLVARRAAGAYESYTAGDRTLGEGFSAAAGRGAGLGFLAGGLGGAIAGSHWESKRGQRTPYVYSLTPSGGAPGAGAVEARSFSPIAKGACVGLADDALEPVTYERVLAARQAMAEAEKPKAEFDRQMVQTAETPSDPTADIVILVPLPSVAC